MMATRTMRMDISVEAPAKLNLHLQIAGRRADGFHEILSLFQAVSLGDRLRIRSLPSKDVLQLTGGADISLSEHLAARAVAMFRRITGIRTGLRIDLEKKIPVGAGLGGGSSDAAAVLRALRRLFPGALSEAELAGVAEALGSDVPFFLTGEACSVVTGRGEKVMPVESRRDFVVVLMHPGFPIPTNQAYRWYDHKPSARARGFGSPEDVAAHYRKLRPCEWEFFNDFEEVVEAHHPVIGVLTARMRRAGAAYAGLSGSGSSVYGLFVDRESAVACRRAFGETVGYATVVEPSRGTL